MIDNPHVLSAICKLFSPLPPRMSHPLAHGRHAMNHDTDPTPDGARSNFGDMDERGRLKRGRGTAARIRSPRFALPASPRPSRGPDGGQPSPADHAPVFPCAPQGRPDSGHAGLDGFHTPAPARNDQPQSSMPHPEIIPEESVTLQRLARVFQQAFYRFELDEDRYLVVETDGPSVLLTINQDLQLLKFQSLHRFKPYAPPDRKLALVNRLNDSVLFARFALPEGEENILVADYYLPFIQGAPTYQIVHTLRLFAKIVPVAIQCCDEEDLLE